MRVEERQFLGKIKKFLTTEVKCHLNKIDEDQELLKKTFRKFRENKFFNLYIPKEFGGMEPSKFCMFKYQEIMGRWGGTLAFLQAQTATATWLLKRSPNSKLQSKIFKKITSGKYSLGNVLSYLKPETPNTIKAIETKAGYRISGKINFVSGFQFFDYLLFGFRNESNKEIFVLIPFKANKELKMSPCIEVIAMLSLNTVSLTFLDYEIKKSQIVLSWDKNTFFDNYRNFPPYVYPLGIGIEALALIKIQEKSLDTTTRALLTQFIKRYKELKIKLLENVCLEQRHKLFAEIMRFAKDSIFFAILSIKGKSLLKNNDIQRLYRELPIWMLPKSSPAFVKKFFDFN